MRDITQKSYDKIHKTYKKDTVGNQPVSDLNKFLSLIEGENKIRILDLGCAVGRDVKFFVARGCETVGVDFSKEMVRSARDNVPGAKFYKKKIEKISFRDNSFDGVWAAASFQHIKKKSLPHTLKKVHNILKDGGVFFIDLRAGEGERIEHIDEYGVPIKRFFAYYTEKELVNYIEKVGFEVIDSRSFSEMYHGRERTKIRIFARK